MQRNLTVAEAQDTILEAVFRLAPETVESAAALSRVLAEDEDAVAPRSEEHHVGIAQIVEIDLSGREDADLVAEFLGSGTDQLGELGGVPGT